MGPLNWCHASTFKCICGEIAVTCCGIFHCPANSDRIAGKIMPAL